MATLSIECITPEWVSRVLRDFEARPYFLEMDLSSAIRSSLEERQTIGDEDRKIAFAETDAFDFEPSRHGEKSQWGTHFGPILSMGEKCLPPLTSLDVPVVEYWRRRMDEAKHPVMRARYADLVWDFWKVVTGKEKPPIEAARTAIDAYAQFAGLPFGDNTPFILHRLIRGLSLAVSIGDQTRIALMRGAVYAFGAKVNDPQYWAMLFDVFTRFPKLELTEPQETGMVGGLELLVANVGNKAEGSLPFESLPIAARLAIHYRKKKQEKDVHRVIRSVGEAIERCAAKADGLLGQAWLDELYGLYKTYGLNEDAKRVLIASRSKGEEAEKQMPMTSIAMKIPEAALEQWLEEVSAGGLGAALEKFVGRYVPDLARLKKQMEELAKAYPISHRMEEVQLREGQVVARVGSLESDPDGRLVQAISNDIGLMEFWVAKFIDRIRERYSPTVDDIVDYLYQSPVFGEKSAVMITNGIKAYFSGDHLTAVHLFVPQIENAMRRLLEMLGEAPNKPRRGDLKEKTEKTLNDILDDKTVKAYLGEDVVLYLSTFLADPRGRNLRNRMAHGLMSAAEFHRGASDRVFHILLLLSGVERSSHASTSEKSG
jgi:hypothetical protein